MSVIFVAGVHGVGKTTCCTEATKILLVPHYTASSVIKSEKASAISGLSKKVRDVNENQDHLINGVQKIIDAGARRFILDGHFTILSSQGQVMAIDVEVFARLNIGAVVVYQDDPHQIHARLHIRDKSGSDVVSITAHQNMELEHARAVTATLQVPIVHLSAFDSSGLIEIASSVWGHQY